jgi:VanW like protein
LETDFTLAARLLFTCKANGLRLRRAMRDALRRDVHCGIPAPVAGSPPPLLAEVRGRLWHSQQHSEFWHQAGKIHNLRVAVRRLNGIDIPAARVFSFWRQMGRPLQRHGYVAGREVREGCLIPSIGGGLCQLSNLLYQAALKAGFDIVERHAHSQVVSGSAAALGQDATVFWNYIDLRFRSSHPWRLEASVEAEELVVRLYGQAPAPAKKAMRSLPPIVGTSANDCATCGQDTCSRHAPELATRGGKCAVLVDEHWPEFSGWLGMHAPHDLLLSPWPLHGMLARRLPTNYAWPANTFQHSLAFPLQVVRRSRHMRGLAEQGAARQQALLDWSARFAAAYAKKLGYEYTDLVVAQSLLPFLQQAGELGGRRVTVLAHRLPLKLLHQRLDQLAKTHPGSRTAADFRTDDALVAAEWSALQSAHRIITPHAEIAAAFPATAELLAWQQLASTAPAAQTRSNDQMPTVFFPASTVARKGAYELRTALQKMPVPVRLLQFSSQLEGEQFWQDIEGIALETVTPRTIPWQRIDAVCLPTWIETRPYLLLQALMRGIPVITTLAAGLHGDDHLLTLTPIGDSAALRDALQALVLPTAATGQIA